MELVKISKDIKLTKTHTGFKLHAAHDIRIAPMETVEVSTGVKVKEMSKNQFIMVDLEQEFALERPFVLKKQIYAQETKGSEIKLIIQNVGNIPATIDRHQLLVIGIHYDLSTQLEK